MKLSQYAKEKGITYKTAWEWFRAGQIVNAYQMPSGTIIVDPPAKMPAQKERNVIYARVSNANRKAEMNYQVTRIEDFCIARGMQITAVYKEVASGMNDNRREFWKMINSEPTTIVVENKDRLTRFGFRYLEQLLGKQGTKILVIHENVTDEQDLIKDLVSIITSFCCRLCGLRRGHNKAKKIREQINETNN